MKTAKSLTFQLGPQPAAMSPSRSYTDGGAAPTFPRSPLVNRELRTQLHDCDAHITKVRAALLNKLCVSSACMQLRDVAQRSCQLPSPHPLPALCCCKNDGMHCVARLYQHVPLHSEPYSCILLRHLLVPLFDCCRTIPLFAAGGQAERFCFRESASGADGRKFKGALDCRVAPFEKKLWWIS